MVNIKPYVKANTEYELELQPHRIILTDLSNHSSQDIPLPPSRMPIFGTFRMKFSDIPSAEVIAFGWSEPPC